MEPVPPNLFEIFDRAQEITDAAERSAYLDRACAGDEVLRKRVEELLEAARHAPAVFPEESSVHTGNSTLAASEGGSHLTPPHFQPGATIGRYEVIRSIGQGGFGEVYLAVQRQPVFRNVALKVIRKGKDNQQVIRRFEGELQVLTLMDHPNIAKLYDAGQTDEGLPFFVMELVSGSPITTYCRKHELDLRSVLNLFQQVCMAVQHAHMKGIIHRDLKPTNILVTEVDGSPVCKVIDFGVAKALDTSIIEAESLTESFQIIGTLFYMSPEQASSDHPAIDVRADVYSLGTVLYELLTGLTPLTRKELGNATLLQALRTIQELEPPRPSMRLLAVLDGSSDSEPPVKTEVRTLCREVQGDIDWIVMKALEKDRARRYQSVHDFRHDIERYLGNQTISARPPSAWYRARKFAQRHRTRMVTAGVAIAVLLMAVVAGALQRSQLQANALVESLLTARPEAVGALLDAVDQQPRLVRGKLAAARDSEDATVAFRAGLALIAEETNIVNLLDQLARMPAVEMAAAVERLSGRSAEAVDWAWASVNRATLPGPEMLRAAAILARHDSSSTNWMTLGPIAARQLVQTSPFELSHWLVRFEPVAGQLQPELEAIFHQTDNELHALAAAQILAHFLRSTPDELVSLVETARPAQLPPLIEALRDNAADAAGRLVERFSQTSNATGTPEESERDHERRVRVGAALLQLDNGEPVWTALAEAAPADPSFRTHLIHGLPAVGTPARVLLDRLTAETDSAIRPAIFSALGEYDPVMLPQSTRDIWQPVLLELLRNEPDAGTRSMVEWLLRHWGYGETVDAVLQELAVAGQVPGREWHVTPSGITMIQITGPVDFQMGTTDPNYSGFLSPPHHRRIPRSFWIATRPVLLREAAEFPGVSASPNWAPNLAPETPALLLSQADARRFCNWLSRREGIAEDQLCYLDAEGGHPMPKANHLNLSGYRLPTEAEWEFTARAGSTNRFHFGETETHLAKYVWHDLNSEGLQHAALLRPNALGLFDTLGNADQWCDVPFVPYPTNTTAAAPAIDGYEYAAGAEATRFAALRTATGDELSTPLLVDWAHRGGSVLTHPRFLGSTLRDASGPRVIHQYITVRLVRSIPFPATSRSDLKGNPNPTDPSL